MLNIHIGNETHITKDTGCPLNKTESEMKSAQDMKIRIGSEMKIHQHGEAQGGR
jgi:hypothetical protein